jgi:probable rRNA maturation factor
MEARSTQEEVKIAFHNRQRRLQLDFEELQQDLARLAVATGENLLQKPPKWLKKKQLRAIFERGSLSVTIVSDAMIRKVNKEWRQIDKATDVLSFPMELEEPAMSGLPGLSGLSGVSGADMPPEMLAELMAEMESEGDGWIVGDIIISAEKAKKQAEEYGHSLKRELAFLFVHGCLHVLGFDHMTAEEEKEMFGRQKTILASCGIERQA